MSNYEDWATDQARDAAVQAQGEYEQRPQRVCSFHARNFPMAKSNVIEDGGNGITHSACGACAVIEAENADRLLAEQEVEKARAAARDDWESFTDELGDRENPYVDMQHYLDSI